MFVRTDPTPEHADDLLATLRDRERSRTEARKRGLEPVSRRRPRIQA